MINWYVWLDILIFSLRSSGQLSESAIYQKYPLQKWKRGWRFTVLRIWKCSNWSDAFLEFSIKKKKLLTSLTSSLHSPISLTNQSPIKSWVIFQERLLECHSLEYNIFLLHFLSKYKTFFWFSWWRKKEGERKMENMIKINPNNESWISLSIKVSWPLSDEKALLKIIRHFAEQTYEFNWRFKRQSVEIWT